MVKGMKQTEIGMIPEDWEVAKLKDIADFQNGLAHENIESEFGEFIAVNSKFISQDGKVFRKVTKQLLPLFNNDLCIVMSDIPNGKALAKCFLVEEDGRYTLNQRIGRISPIKDHSKYLFYTLNRNKYFLGFDSGSGQTNLRKDEVLACPVPLPPLPEQEAIAGALSDADSWIESLEQLIAKKRLIKQGAMQELLTPKEGWEVKSIFEIADSKRDLFNDGDWIESEHIVDEGIRLVQTGNIGIGKFLNKANRKYINELSFNKLKCKELREGDLLICRLAEPAGRACLFPKTDDYKSVTSVDVTIYRPDVQKYDRRFLLFSLSTDQWFTDVIEQVGGTTHKRISRGNLGRIKISVPSLTEQTRIATILSDMDAELEALEQQLHKARQIKPGMMQELLTGRVRLNYDAFDGL